MNRRLLPLLLVIAAAVFVITHFVWLAQMPERIASHFNGMGKPNGWMTRSGHSAFMLMFGLGEPAFVLTLIWAMRFLPANLLNVPKPEYWRSPENYPKACAIMLAWAQSLAIAMLLWNTFFNWQIVKANLMSPPHLANADVGWLTGALLATVGCSIAWLIWRFRKTDDVKPAPSMA
jgi:serine/threonine-protein kinase